MDIFARKKLNQVFKKITNKTINFTTYREAEILKLIDNSYRDTIFGFANELARIGEYFGINILNVIKKSKNIQSFIPEIWQGHKNNGEGFWVALKELENKL